MIQVLLHTIQFVQQLLETLIMLLLIQGRLQTQSNLNNELKNSKGLWKALENRPYQKN